MITPRRHLSEDAPAAAAAAAVPPAPAAARSAASLADRDTTPPALAALKRAGTGLREFGAFVWKHRSTALLIGIPYLAAWWLPFYWCFREDRWWARWESAIIFQPFVPLGVVALAWADRARLASAWGETQYRFSERRRSGSLLLLVLGCALLFGAHLVHVAAIAVVALILIAAGVVLRQYGGMTLRALALPLLFFLTMLPPPSSLVSHAEKFFMWGGARAVSTLMRGSVSVSGNNMPQVVVGGAPVEITPAVNGLNVVLFLAAVLLLVGMLRRMRALTTVLMMTTGAFLALLLNFARVSAMAVTAGGSPRVSGFFGALHPLLFVALALVLTLALERRLRPSLEWAGKRFGWLGRMTARSERAAENLADTAGRTVGRRILRAGSASTTFTERLLRNMERAARRRRRHGHGRGGGGR